MSQSITMKKNLLPSNYSHLSNFFPKTWNGHKGFAADWMWTDGSNIYYSLYEGQYVLNKETDTWEPKTWNGFAPYEGNDIWTDGTNIYYSDNERSNEQYVLDKETDTWEPKTWNGLTVESAWSIWTDGTHIYYSRNSDHYILNGDTWESKTWSGLVRFSGSDIWSDGTNIYHSDGTYQYILNGDTWEQKTWNGFTNIEAQWIWSDGTNFYHSNGSQHHVLNKETDTWEEKTWAGLSNFHGRRVWSDGSNIYYSYDDSEQYVLIPSTAKLYSRSNGEWVEVGEIDDGQDSGECSGNHIIEVDKLPEAGEVGNVYKCQGKYYEYSTAFQDLIISQEGESMSFADIFGALGITIKCYYHTLPTKPTEMPVLSQDGIDLFYIEDENDIFLCGESDGQIQWVTFREALGSDTDVDVGSFLGTITDISEATENGYYALCPPWIPYVYASGTLDIAENGEYDVAETEKVKVEVPSKSVVGKRRFNDWPTMSLPYISQKVNFTAMYEGKLAKCVEMGAGPSGSFLEDRIHYYLEDGGGGSVFSLGWYYEESRMVDFGNTPQIVSDKFAEFIENNTEPVYDHIDEVATEIEMNALLETAEDGAVFKYTGPTTDAYKNGSLYIVHTPMISFTIDGTEYQAEEDMTFAQWCASKYNMIGCTNATVEELVYNSDATKHLSVSDTGVYGKDVINANVAYVFVNIPIEEPYTEEPNEYGTTVIINQHSEQANDYGTTVVIGEEDEVNLITFTIDGTEYRADEGMTWLEWVNSEYNTEGYTCTTATDYVELFVGIDWYLIERVDGTNVVGSEQIINGENYHNYHNGTTTGGGND